MASQPYTPKARPRATVVPIVSRVGGAAYIPTGKTTSIVDSAPSVILSANSAQLANYNVSAIFSTNLAFSVPALTTNAPISISAKATITTFPTSFRVSPGGTAFVLETATLSRTPALAASVLVLNVSSAFVYGVNSSPTTGSLSPGIIYTLPAIYVILTVMSLGVGVPAFTFNMVVQAILLGAVQ